MSNTTCVIVNPDVVLREEDEDGALLFHPDTNHLQVINATGTYLWHRCDGTRDYKAFADSLVEEFDGLPEDSSMLLEQVQEFFDDLVAKGFVGFMGEPEASP